MRGEVTSYGRGRGCGTLEGMRIVGDGDMSRTASPGAILRAAAKCAVRTMCSTSWAKRHQAAVQLKKQKMRAARRGRC